MSSAAQDQFRTNHTFKFLLCQFKTQVTKWQARSWAVAPDSTVSRKRKEAQNGQLQTQGCPAANTKKFKTVTSKHKEVQNSHEQTQGSSRWSAATSTSHVVIQHQTQLQVSRRRTRWLGGVRLFVSLCKARKSRLRHSTVALNAAPL